MDVVKLGRGQSSVYIKGEILEFLQDNVKDYIAIRKANGPSDDGLINEIIQKKSPREDRMPLALYEFLTESTGDDPSTSLSRCGEFKSMELRSFINTKRTPRQERFTNHMY